MAYHNFFLFIISFPFQKELNHPPRSTTSTCRHLSQVFSIMLNFDFSDREWEERNTHQSERWRQSKARPLDKIFSIGCPTFRRRAPFRLLVFARLHSSVHSPRMWQDPAVLPLACRRQPAQRDAACSWWLIFGGFTAGGAFCLKVQVVDCGMKQIFSLLCALLWVYLKKLSAHRHGGHNRLRGVSVFILP